MKQILEKLKTIDRDKILHLFLLVLFGAVMVYGFYLSTSTKANQQTSQNSIDKITGEFKCPDEYKNQKEWEIGIKRWTEWETAINPDITEDELLEKRAKEFADMHCEEATSWYFPDDFYATSSEARNKDLFLAVMAWDYQPVVDATNDGIRNHKELVWDDLDFWVYRGMALFYTGECGDAIETFNHALEIDPQDETALGFMDIIGICGVDDEILQMRREFNKNTKR